MWYSVIALVNVLFLIVFAGYKAKEIDEDNPVILGFVILLISFLWPLFWVVIVAMNLYELGKFLRALDSRGKVSANSKRG